MNKIKVSAVSYLNTLPFVYGIEQDVELMKQMVLSKDHPAECARKLLDNEVDLGLVPVAIIPGLKESHIVSDYCIGARGKVKSVLLVSNVPLEEIKTIYLDYQSRTSVRLCQLLVEQFWKLKVDYQLADIGYEDQITGTGAAVIIGDRAFHLKDKYAYRYDLAEEWEKWQQLPFVFAVWLSNKSLPEAFLKQFNLALQFGLQHIDQAIAYFSLDTLPAEEQSDYLKQSIHYELDDQKRKGLNRYLKFIQHQ